MRNTSAREGNSAAGPAQMPRVSPGWLQLREAADAGARAAELVSQVRRFMTGASGVVIHDLGCGTGSMGRWLASRLPIRQHWIMYDRDPDLLGHAARRLVRRTGDGPPVTAEVRQADITRLTADDLRSGIAGPTGNRDGTAVLVTASALLDLLTAAEVERLVAACVAAGCPALLTLSVVGRVDLTPADPLDARVAAAFNAHQRRTVAGRRLLGPDATAATVAAFTRRGVATVVHPSPWRLGADAGDLVAEWFLGWVDAACEQSPELSGPMRGYTRRRLAELADGRFEVVVHHDDLLAGVDEH